MDDHMAGSASSSTGIVGNIHIADRCTDLTDQVHQLPCCIKYNGQCPVSDYFKPKTTGVVWDELELKEAAFRGRKLAGTTLPIPENYCGLVLEKEKPGQKRGHAKGSNLKEGEVDIWNASAAFQNITYWNHDTIPSKTDTLYSCFHWFTVANAIHKPITAAEVASAIHENGIKNGKELHVGRRENLIKEAEIHELACLLYKG